MPLERLRRRPERLLPLGHDPARHDRVDPDAMLSEVAGERARHAVHRGLGRRVDRKASRRLPPRVRAEIDDRPSARRDHVGRDGLGREEHVLQVHGDPLVVIFRRDVLPGMPVVARGVVDQHGSRTERRLQSSERPLQLIYVAQVAAFESDRGAFTLQLLRKRRASRLVEIDKADLRALRGEGPHQLHADAARTAGDIDDLALQARIDREGFRHVLSLFDAVDDELDGAA